LENSGIFTFSCLGQLNEEELAEMCQMVRAAGFGLGHGRALRELAGAARLEKQNGSRPECDLDAAPILKSQLSPMLWAGLCRKNLQRLEPILGQRGIQSFECLGQLSGGHLEDMICSIRASGFDMRCVSKFRQLHDEAHTGRDDTCMVKEEIATDMTKVSLIRKIEQVVPGLVGMPKVVPSPLRNSADIPLKAVEGGQSGPASHGMRRCLDEHWEESLDVPRKRLKIVGKPYMPSSSTGKENVETLQCPSRQHAFLKPKPEEAPARQLTRAASSTDDEQCYSMKDSRAADPCCRKARVSRESIMETLSNIRKLDAEVVRYRDRATGKMLDARIPEVVLALLRIKASCSGQEVSEQRLARMAVDVMEEQAYDPVRAVASLSPASLLCPTTAMRVLGSGFVGVVFLEEETRVVVKVMLEDFAQKEYDVFCMFAEAGLTPHPLSFHGPCDVPGGKLFSIHMKEIPHTLHKLLQAKVTRGPRHGLSPPSKHVAEIISTKLVAIFQRMWDTGCVHGDLHLHNIGLEDLEAQGSIQLMDFGRSAHNAAWREESRKSKEAFLGGHEYDIFRLLNEMLQAFEELREEFEANAKECEKEIRELKRMRETGASSKEHLLHIDRQIVGLRAYVDEEPRHFDEAEAVYNTIVGAIVKYANAKFPSWCADAKFPSSCSVAMPLLSRPLRQAAARREKAAHKVYFASTLFWGDCMV
jgi:tRNA A-37 threonylcarbamoyl transferase component Bud32